MGAVASPVIPALGRPRQEDLEFKAKPGQHSETTSQRKGHDERKAGGSVSGRECSTRGAISVAWYSWGDDQASRATSGQTRPGAFHTVAPTAGATLGPPGVTGN
jgi:hypothetical protein